MDFLTDPVFLSRLQFALTTAFHITFPTLTIGLGVYLVVVEWLWLRTGDLVYFRQFRFWSRLFAVNFAVGVVSGIPLEFQFGANWGPFSASVGNFFGQVLGFEGTMAFMLESAFLYIMLFGWKRVGPKMHFAATILVAFAASLSAFWILVANSWMQTPAGGHMANGLFVVDNYLAAIFSPDLPLAFSHMYIACLELTLFVIGAVSAGTRNSISSRLRSRLSPPSSSRRSRRLSATPTARKSAGSSRPRSRPSRPTGTPTSPAPARPGTCSPGRTRKTSAISSRSRSPMP